MKPLSLWIAGAAGEGIQTIGDAVARSFLAHGYPAFATSEFESRIRGGHSSVRIRVADDPVNAPASTADCLLAVNPDALAFYLSALRPEGLAIGPEGAENASVCISFKALAEEEGGELYANAVAAGALCATVGLPIDTLKRVLADAFARRGGDVVRANTSAAQRGFDATFAQLENRRPDPLPAREGRYAFASAHETIPIGAAAAGCRFMSAYPMSPSTGIITAFAKNPQLGVFTEQAEDEIAAINMSLGASAAGARAMTATSGGGFALMTEGVSLAGMTETPIVILVAQRPGPATGLPTRTAQEDLLFALRGGHGEFPRAILAPSDPQDAIQLTIRAFDLADRYQIPVILLTDQYLADSSFALGPLVLPSTEAEDPTDNPSGRYLRYRLTEDGISPRRPIGHPKHLVVIDSDEHDEAGHITEDLERTRPAMVEKRLEKGRRLKLEMAPPSAYGIEEADRILIGWGSSKGAIDEAITRLREAGESVGSLHFTELWPLPDLDLPEAEYWVVESNATGQFAGLLESGLGLKITGRIGRYDGRPIDAEAVLEGLT